MTNTALTDVDRELRRCVDRLGTLGAARLAHADRAAALSAALQYLADTAADHTGEPRRSVPQLAAHAAGHQLIVLTNDAVAAAAEPADLEALTDALVTLRRALG